MEMRVDSEAATEDLGRRLSAVLPAGARIHLQGELGAGKTTLARGFLRGLGFKGNVKSPTYTLVESYLIENKIVYHFDLYRLHDPEELEAMGIRDYLDEQSICLVEWPERAGDLLPAPDLTILLKQNHGGRLAEFRAGAARGRSWLAALAQDS